MLSFHSPKNSKSKDVFIFCAKDVSIFVYKTFSFYGLCWFLLVAPNFIIQDIAEDDFSFCLSPLLLEIHFSLLNIILESTTG